MARARWPYVAAAVAGFFTVRYLLKRGHSSLLGAAVGPIKSIQLDLQKIGLPVQPTGVLDDPTVVAINGVFQGSVDVPPKLATGNLTKHDIAKNLSVVARSLKVIVHGAMVLPSVEEGG